MFFRFRRRPREPELPRDLHIRRDIGLPPLLVPLTDRWWPGWDDRQR